MPNNLPEQEVLPEHPYKLRALKSEDKVRGLHSGGRAYNPLKTFFQKQAKNFQTCSLARTYVAFLSENGRIVAYITLICAEIDAHAEAEGVADYDYDSYPAVKIARLMVDERHRHHHLGETLIDFAVGTAKDTICPHVGCRFIVVDAKQQAIGFYKHCGFRMIETVENKGKEEPVMFIDLQRTNITE